MQQTILLTRIIPPTSSYAISPPADTNAIAGSSANTDIPSQSSHTGGDPSTLTSGSTRGGARTSTMTARGAGEWWHSNGQGGGKGLILAVSALHPPMYWLA